MPTVTSNVALLWTRRPRSPAARSIAEVRLSEVPTSFVSPNCGPPPSPVPTAGRRPALTIDPDRPGRPAADDRQSGRGRNEHRPGDSIEHGLSGRHRGAG